MKTTKLILAATLMLLWAMPQALADIVYPAAYPVAVYGLPYDAEGSSVQMVQRAQAFSPQPCGCPYSCLPHKVQAPAPPPPTVIAQEDRTVYFGFNKANLDDGAKQKLNSLAGRLMSANDVTGARIIGYADRVGTVSYNEALSQRRAENVRFYLTDAGFIKPSETETRWVGKSQPGTHCSKYLPRARLLRCLQPDRKVEVNIQYRTQTQPVPVD